MNINSSVRIMMCPGTTVIYLCLRIPVIWSHVPAPLVPPVVPTLTTHSRSLRNPTHSSIASITQLTGDVGRCCWFLTPHGLSTPPVTVSLCCHCELIQHRWVFLFMTWPSEPLACQVMWSARLSYLQDYEASSQGPGLLHQLTMMPSCRVEQIIIL